jgi:hypothetical protein
MSNKLYTLKDWRKDHVLKVKIGQYVDYGVINQLMDGLPPLTYDNGIFQPGEPYDHNIKTGELLFRTFVEDGGYRYVGLCPEGSTVDESKDSYGYQRDINKNNIQENKKHMKITEKELHNLINECVQEYIQENQLNEGFWDKMGFLGRSGANAAGNAAQKVGNAVSGAYNKAKTAVNNYTQDMNTYSSNMDQAKAMDKHAKMVNKIMPTLRELKTTLQTDKTLNSKQRGYLNSAIRFLNTFVQTLQQQGQQYRDNANAVFNKQQPQQSQPGIAAESTKRLEKIIKESIKRNLK